MVCFKVYAVYTRILFFSRFYYYTAGSGGAGPTILATSFLLLGEEVVAYNKGQSQQHFTTSTIRFSFYCSTPLQYLNNGNEFTEVRSAHDVLGIPTEFLKDRTKVQQLVQLFDPLVEQLMGLLESVFQ
ncbi:hypothetical protein NC652_024292 [Populus alba x Populus x berolinensis]|nr:hypothetical protein NC652_024292 [Populus alba x Populus x berolinensis]